MRAVLGRPSHTQQGSTPHVNPERRTRPRPVPLAGAGDRGTV